jgi:guanine deaminase
MSRTILRGRVLSFLSEPQGIDDTASYRYLEDGAITIEDGRIVAVGDYVPVADAEVIDHRPHLILPGFIDTHLHLPR